MFPSVNVTDPAATARALPMILTLAVNVTGCPKVEVLDFAVNEVRVPSAPLVGEAAGGGVSGFAGDDDDVDEVGFDPVVDVGGPDALAVTLKGAVITCATLPPLTLSVYPVPGLLSVNPENTATPFVTTAVG